ncbi:hypothetical protein Droror1_Dr00022062 [Drosera rotundifolia]
MGKVSPKEKAQKTPRQKRRSRSSGNKYLKPGALAQLRYSKALAAKSCTDLGKKRVALLGVGKKVNDDGFLMGGEVIEASPPTVLPSPQTFCFSPVGATRDRAKLQRSILASPKTPVARVCDSESRLEALPLELLVHILCHLHHDQLRAVFHVSHRLMMAVLVARQLYFNYTTPDRSRQEMLRTMTPLPTEHWPFVSRGHSRGVRMPSPCTPKAPKHGPRPPSCLKYTEMKQVAAVLFQESPFSTRCVVPSVLSKPPCKNRALLYEDELCQAVSENKLR